MRGGYRVSIAGLVWAVAFAAVWLAAVKSGSNYWSAAAGVIAIGAILTSVVGAVDLRRRSRAFCFGFALFSLGFAIEVHNNWTQVGLGVVLFDASSLLAGHVIPPLPPRPAGLGVRATTAAEIRSGDLLLGEYNRAIDQRQGKLNNLMKMTSLSFLLAMGLLGGLIALAMAALSRNEDRPGAAA